MGQAVGIVIAVVSLLVAVGIVKLAISFFRKIPPGYAMVRTGSGGMKVSFNSMWVIPIMHRPELMDVSVKRIEINRAAEDGLVCKDNIRADIKVAFFVRVNNEEAAVKQVAQSLGCKRASDQMALIELFDAKFSDALKTVGKEFEFVQLYTDRALFRDRIVQEIGEDLNGYKLEDAAIDYLEQTSLDKMDPHNVLDSEGIKKITDITSHQAIKTNAIEREKQKVIKKQDVEAKEAILELEKQQIEAEEKQKREIAEVTSRQVSAAKQVHEEERLKAERARIATEEEVNIAEENKDRQVIVAQRNKERTDAVELVRVDKERDLESTERERVVELAQIEKEKAVEVEKKAIQDVIRERVAVERSVVEEEERIKDTREFATADRSKKVAITQAEQIAQEDMEVKVRAAQAQKQAAEFEAQEIIIEAEAKRAAAEKETQMKKMLAEAKTAEEAATGLAEAQVTEVKAAALQKEGTAEAVVIEKKASAEAMGVAAMADAKKKDGTAEAEVMQLKFSSEATGITEKAEAMKLFDGVGREHEEFKLRLNKDKDIELAAINIQEKIATRQAEMLGAALKTAKIDIVGGESQFFDKIINSISAGKAVDRMVDNSRTLTDIKDTFFNGDGDYFKKQIAEFIDQFHIGSEDVKNLSISALLLKMMDQSKDKGSKTQITDLLETVRSLGIGDKTLDALNLR